MRLLLAVSEAWLGCGSADCTQKALQHAQRALDLAEEHDAPLAAARLQLGRYCSPDCRLLLICHGQS